MKIKLFSFVTILFFAITMNAQKTGEELFKECRACHTLTETKLVGPGLEGVLEKREKAWLKSWITSSSKLIASGDADAIALFEEYNKVPMADYSFSDEEFDLLFDFMGGKTDVKEAETTVEEVKAPSNDVAEIVEEPSSFAKAFENRPVFKLFFWMSVLLLLFTMIGVLYIYFDREK